MKILVILILVFIFGCKSNNNIYPNLEKVGSISICSSNKVANFAKDSSVSELYNLYKNSDIKKTNYEVFCTDFSFGLNWNPVNKLLFAGYGSDLCDSWDVVYINVDEKKITDFIAKKVNVSKNINLYDSFSLYFEEEKDKLKKVELKSKYFVTNSCKGKG